MTSTTISNQGNIEILAIPSTITTLGSYSISVAEKLRGTVIPQSVSTLSSYCMEMCANIYSLELSEGLETISDPFSTIGFVKYARLRLPSTLKTISSLGYGTITVDYIDFSKCANLESIAFGGMVNCSSVVDLRPCYGLKTIADLRGLNFILPKDATDLTINSNAFYFCSGIIYIPACVTTINGPIGYYGVIFYCEAERKPDGWVDNWADDASGVVDTASVQWGVPYPY